MGSSKSRLLPSCSSKLGSSGPAGPGPTPPRLGTRKGLKLSADSGGDGVEGLDWSLGADQLQYPPEELLLDGVNGPTEPLSFHEPLRPSVKMEVNK